MKPSKSWLLLLLCLLLGYSHTRAETLELAPLLNYVEDIADSHHKDKLTPVPIIAIGGCPGVGKTYFTKELFADLKERKVRCIILPLDHFNLSRAERKKIGTEWDTRHFKGDELHRILSEISTGKKLIIKPTLNQLTDEAGSETLDLEEIDIVLFDGLYALCSLPPLNFFDYCTAGIYLEAEEADIVAWKWEREQQKTQPRTTEQFAKHIEVIIAEFYKNIAYSKNNATFLIQKDSFHKYHLYVRNGHADFSANDHFISSQSNNFLPCWRSI